jgi:hypothetical protein
MKLLCTVMFMLLLFGCSERKGFDSKLRSIKAGTDKRQVEQSLGRPTVVYTRSSYWGAWLVGASEWWAYEGDAKNGQVLFDDRGKVRYVYGHTGRIVPQ